MSLPYVETASGVASMIGLLVPVLLGLIRGIFRQSGWILLFAAISGLSAWCSLNFSILASIWTRVHEGTDPMTGIGSNGAANAFASIFGWLPGVLLFFATVIITFTAFRWLPNKLKRSEQGGDGDAEEAV
jgi:hypothetical protein